VIQQWNVGRSSASQPSPPAAPPDAQQPGKVYRIGVSWSWMHLWTGRASSKPRLEAISYWMRPLNTP